MANIFNEQIPTGVVVEDDHTPRAWDAIAVMNTDTTRPDVIARQRENNARNLEIGRWFAEHYRRGAAERGHEAVARQLRKQGVPLEIAKLILLGRAE